MAILYTKEQLQKMKSSKLIEIILELQIEVNNQAQSHEQSLTYLQLGFKEQVEAQKEMIKDLLQSEKSLSIQLEKQIEIYNQLKSKLNHNTDKVEIKINNQSKPYGYTTFGDAAKQFQIQVQQVDYKKSCIFKEEQAKKHFEYHQFAFSQSREATPCSSKGKQSNQLLKFPQKSNYLINQLKTPKSANNYLYKSIQSSNYIINPPVDNIIENNIHSLIGTPENENNVEQNEREYYQQNKIQQTEQHLLVPSKLVFDNHSIHSQVQSQNSNKKLSSLTAIQSHDNQNSPQIYPNVTVQLVNQVQREDQNSASKYGPNIKNCKNTPIFESRKQHPSFLDFSGGLGRSQLTQSNLHNQQVSVGSLNNIHACQNLSSKNILQQNIKLGDLLFEDFFIIGPSIPEMEEIAQNYPEVINGTVQPEIYVSFPGQLETNDQHQRQSMKNFCYPFNVEFNKHYVHDLRKGKVDDILNLQIFKPNVSQNSPNQFVFSMLGETERSQDKSIINPVLIESNPHLSLYCVCFTTENFLTVPKQKGGMKEEENCIFLVPITYCFLTYYPFINHFLDIISEIVNQSKIMRGTEYMKLFTDIDEQICLYCKQNRNSMNSNNNSNTKREIKLLPTTQQIVSTQSMNSLSNSNSSQKSQNDSNNQMCSCQQKEILSKILTLDIENEINNFNSYKFEKIREALSNSQTQKPQYDLDLKFKYRIDEQFFHKNYKVPDQNNISYIESEWGACLTIGCLSLEDFLFIFTAVSLEKMIIFFSNNVSLLTSCILTFYSILKPFNYVLPAIFNVPSDLLNLIDSPVPLIIGINKDISFKAELESSGFDFNEKIIVDLDSGLIICEQSQFQQQIEKSMPVFKSFQNEIIESYFQINPRPSKQLKTFNSIRKKKNSQSTNKSFKNLDTIIHETHPTQQNQMKIFLENIRKCMENYFIKNLPSKTQQLIKEFKYQEIQNIVEKKNKDDCEFVKQFTKTQIFTSYIESVHQTSQ